MNEAQRHCCSCLCPVGDAVVTQSETKMTVRECKG